MLLRSKLSPLFSSPERGAEQGWRGTNRTTMMVTFAVQSQYQIGWQSSVLPPPTTLVATLENVYKPFLAPLMIQNSPTPTKLLSIHQTKSSNNLQLASNLSPCLQPINPGFCSCSTPKLNTRRPFVPELDLNGPELLAADPPGLNYSDIFTDGITYGGTGCPQKSAGELISDDVS